MRYVLRCTLVGLLCGSLWAQSAPQQKSRTGRTGSSARQAPAAPAATAEDIKSLRDALAAQQLQIEELRQRMESRDAQLQQTQQQLQQAQAAASDAQARLAAFQGAATQQQDSVGKLQADVSDIKMNMTNNAATTQEDQKRVSALESLLGRFRFSGDIRVRQEDFFHSGTTPRVRERIRLRFGVESKLNEDFLAGIFLATGALTQPTSANETLTSAFERKTVGFDRGYLIYQPQAHPWLQLTGGKFAYTWSRTPQTFDNDVNPEGFSEKLSFNIPNSVLKELTFTGMQLLFNEVAVATAPDSSSCAPNFQFCANALNTTGGDSFAVGGQVSAKLQLGKRLTISPAYSVLNWRNENTLLNQPASVTGNTSLTVVPGTPNPVVSFSSAAFAPNGMTNATVRVGTAANGAPILAFASKFLYSDLILDSTLDTGLERFPVRVLLEYLDNLNAVKISPVLGRQSHLYKAEASFGQLKKRNDLQFGYGFWRQEQDSVLAAFNESNQRAPTNVVQHHISGQWMVRDNVTAAFALWNGRTLNSNLVNARLATGISPGQVEPYLKRMQFDLIYKF